MLEEYLNSSDIYDTNKEKLDLLTFGKQFHPDIESLIKFYKEKILTLK